MFQYTQFDQCIDLLTTPIEHLSPMHPEQSPLLGSSEKIADFFVETFTLGLENELLTKKTPEQKADLIRHYVSRLMKSKNHKPVKDIHLDVEAKMPATDNEEIAPEITRMKDMLIMDIPNNLDYELRFQRGCNILYHLLFDELQKCCLVFDIPFIKICRELKFDLETIDFKISLEHKESKNIPRAEKPKDTKPLKLVSPTFTPESVPRIFDVLKDFFSPKQQPELYKILQGRGNALEPLLFMDTGNRLADAFKQLYDCGFIKGCKKKELENWIGENFLFRKGDMENHFSPKYLNDIISTTQYHCKRPILNIMRDKVAGDYLISKI